MALFFQFMLILSAILYVVNGASSSSSTRYNPLSSYSDLIKNELKLLQAAKTMLEKAEWNNHLILHNYACIKQNIQSKNDVERSQLNYFKDSLKALIRKQFKDHESYNDALKGIDEQLILPLDYFKNAPRTTTLQEIKQGILNLLDQQIKGANDVLNTPYPGLKRP